jgi:hypothetical protein
MISEKKQKTNGEALMEELDTDSISRLLGDESENQFKARKSLSLISIVLTSAALAAYALVAFGVGYYLATIDRRQNLSYCRLRTEH